MTMKSKSYGGWLVLMLAMMVAAIPLLAHHSVEAEFYQDKEFEVTGKLAKVDWINPHTFTRVEVLEKNVKREVVCQAHPPNAFRRSGLLKSDWEIGKTVTMTCLAAKSGDRNWGFLKMIKYMDTGRVIVIRDSGV
jgi:hypothetical protein